MALPVIVAPTYELEIPSSKEKITYRPFLVKEEKLLLLAMESDEENEMLTAVRTIIQNCTFEKVNPDDLALFDVEYVFLNIRAKSVGENIKLKLLCEDDGETYADVEIDLEKINIQYTEGHTNHIKLNDDVSLMIKKVMEL